MRIEQLMNKPAIAGSQADLDRQLEEIAWGIFLIMIGLLWFFPQWTLPRDSWLVGPALIVLGLNLARYLNRLRVNMFMTAVALLALAAGIAGIYGIHLRLLPLLPILIGAQLLVRPLMRRISALQGGRHGHPFA